MSTETEITESSQALGVLGTRQKILSAARDEFAQFGIDGARVDRIAKHAGVNKAMLYYHFHSKELLYEAVVKEFFASVATHLKEKIGSFNSIEEALSTMAETHVQMLTQFPGILPILLRELANPNSSLCDWIAKTIGSSGVTAIAQQRLEEAFASGEFRRIDMRHAITSFIAMSMGYFLLSPLMDRVWNITDHQTFINERKKVIVDLFLNGLKVKPV